MAGLFIATFPKRFIRTSPDSNEQKQVISDTYHDADIIRPSYSCSAQRPFAATAVRYMEYHAAAGAGAMDKDQSAQRYGKDHFYPYPV
jgi:hypothetical protein